MANNHNNPPLNDNKRAEIDIYDLYIDNHMPNHENSADIDYGIIPPEFKNLLDIDSYEELINRFTAGNLTDKSGIGLNLG